jgi:hypothetical protein
VERTSCGYADLQVSENKVSSEQACADIMFNTQGASNYAFWPTKTSWQYNCWVGNKQDGPVCYANEIICAGHLPTATPSPTPAVCEACNLKLDTLISSDAVLTSGDSFSTAPAGSSLKLSNVCSIGSQSYDMKLTTLSTYTMKPSKNGVVGPMLRLNMQQGSEATFELKLLKHGTEELASVKELYFSILDVDRNKDKPDETQTVELSGPSEVFKGVEVSETHDNGNYKFVSLRGGDESDNPVDPMNLHDAAISSSVSLKYTDTSTWTVKLSVQGSSPYGRNFFLAGASYLKPSC